MALEIVHAEGGAQLAEVRRLLEEHFAFMYGHWPHMDHGAFAEELAALPEPYPVILLALVDGEPAGCVTFRDVEGEPRTCEVRRLFVRPRFRRRGVARALAVRLERDACGLGYGRMRLVTTRLFEGALPLYESLGFAHVEPFRPSTMPLELVAFMQKDLAEECDAVGE